ncbi:hypothetical protein [Candidatus Methylobacter favarea]|uniref:hypothetical protein n=1 Tax=Candidatus Methylobacter favarea TaxID=2707345 RepID=UPI00157D2C79|nr:hypothetical protein [Candidatus Methylobacter favarea]
MPGALRVNAKLFQADWSCGAVLPRTPRGKCQSAPGGLVMRAVLAGQALPE